MFDYIDHLEAENRELRTFLCFGAGWPEAMKQRAQGAQDLAERLEAVGQEAEWELTGLCQLPAECIFEPEPSTSRSHVDPTQVDTLIIMQPSWLGRDRKLHPTRVRCALVPNQHMKPINAAAETIYEAWQRSMTNVDRGLYVPHERTIIGAARMDSCASFPQRRALTAARLLGKVIAPGRKVWRRAVGWMQMRRRIWTLYDHPRSARRRPLYVKLLLAP